MNDHHKIITWALTVPAVTPLVLLAPEIIAAAAGRPGAEANLSSSDADVMGTSSLLLLMLTLLITPLVAATGCGWLLPLRRRYGLAMAASATVDLVIAAIVTFDTFPGGLLTRVVGHSFLLFGTLAVLLLWPLALTATQRWQRILGRNWKRLHRTVYVIAALVLVHLYLLFGFRSIALSTTAMYVPIFVARIPVVHRFISHRNRGALKYLALAAMAALFLWGFEGIVHELFAKGVAAFDQAPPHD